MEAIISDIHANLEALQAVIADIRENDISDIVCLGDIIGYGPNPQECIDLAMDFTLTLRGNHEQALMVAMEGSGFNSKAKGSLEWTRQQLSMLGEDRQENAPRWDFLGELPKTYEEDGTLYLHGTPRQPVIEYLRPRDIRNRVKMQELFARMEHVCFVGHSHVGGVWTENFEFHSPAKLDNKYALNAQKVFINPGSVGQSRDGDKRASYVIRDGNKLTWRRIQYPVEETADKIRAIPDLDNFLADRLLEGR